MSGMQNNWWVGVDNHSMAITRSDWRVCVNIGLAVVSNGGGEVIESMAILLWDMGQKRWASR